MKTPLSLLLALSPIALMGQFIENTDPVPLGTYGLVRSTGTNSVTMGTGVTTNLAVSIDSSTFTQSGGTSIFNEASDNSTFTQSGGTTVANFAWDNSTFNLLGGTLSFIEVYQSSEINIWADFATSTLDGKSMDGLGPIATYTIADLTSSDPPFAIFSFDIHWADGNNDEFIFKGFDSDLGSPNDWTGSLNLYDTEFFEAGSTTPVPEPATIGLLGIAGIAGILLVRRRIVSARKGAAKS